MKAANLYDDGRGRVGQVSNLSVYAGRDMRLTDMKGNVVKAIVG